MEVVRGAVLSRREHPWETCVFFAVALLLRCNTDASWIPHLPPSVDGTPEELAASKAETRLATAAAMHYILCYITKDGAAAKRLFSLIAVGLQRLRSEIAAEEGATGGVVTDAERQRRVLHRIVSRAERRRIVSNQESVQFLLERPECISSFSERFAPLYVNNFLHLAEVAGRRAAARAAAAAPPPQPAGEDNSGYGAWGGRRLRRRYPARSLRRCHRGTGRRRG